MKKFILILSIIIFNAGCGLEFDPEIIEKYLTEIEENLCLDYLELCNPDDDLCCEGTHCELIYREDRFVFGFHCIQPLPY